LFGQGEVLARGARHVVAPGEPGPGGVALDVELVGAVRGGRSEVLELRAGLREGAGVAAGEVLAEADVARFGRALVDVEAGVPLGR
jgi:hypothetical protein